MLPLIFSTKVLLLPQRMSLMSLSYQDSADFLGELMMEPLHIILPPHQTCIDRDVVCEEISRRFDQKDLKVVIDIERLLIDSANGILRDIPDSITDLYKADIDKDRLSLHLQMLPDAVKQYNSSTVPVRRSPIFELCVMS